MESPDKCQFATWTHWFRGCIFIAIGCVLASAPIWPYSPKGMLVAYFSLLLVLFFYRNSIKKRIGPTSTFGLLSSILRLIKNNVPPRFSLKALLLMTGVVACVVALNLRGGPWKEIHRFPGFEANVAISPDGKLVAASQGTSIEIRETLSGRTVQTIKMRPAEAAMKGKQKWCYSLAFTKDGKSLMTLDWQASPCLLDVATGKELWNWTWTQGMSSLALTGNRFVANSVASTSKSVGVRNCDVYDVELDEPILTIESNYSYSRFISPSGSHVFIAKDKTTAELWNVDDQRLLGTIPTPLIHPGLFFVKFSPDAKLLAVPTSNGIAIWDVKQCRQIAEWKPPKFNRLHSLDWSPDGSRMVASYIEFIGASGPTASAASSARKSMRIAMEHSCLLDQNGHEIAVINGVCASFSPSGDRIATVYGGVNILDGRTGKLLTRVAARPEYFGLGHQSIVFSPDGNWLLTNGSPTVFRRTRSEYWYSIYQVPAFWGMILFLSASLVQISESIYFKILSRKLSNHRDAIECLSQESQLCENRSDGFPIEAK